MSEQLTTKTPPYWVLIEAAKRSDCDVYRRDGAFLALCDMIQKYEKQPVDRKVLCAREAENEYNYVFDKIGFEASVRAIELWEEGFGE
jgi:hypothetical protein